MSEGWSSPRQTTTSNQSQCWLRHLCDNSILPLCSDSWCWYLALVWGSYLTDCFVIFCLFGWLVFGIICFVLTLQGYEWTFQAGRTHCIALLSGISCSLWTSKLPIQALYMATESPIDLLLSWVLEEKVLLSSYWHLNEENPALGSVASAHQHDQKAHDYGWDQGPQYCCPWGVFTHPGRQRYLSKFVTHEAGILPILQLIRSLALTHITRRRNPARERI